VIERLRTTSGPATQAGKGKPEVIPERATHGCIVAQGGEKRKQEKSLTADSFFEQEETEKTEIRKSVIPSVASVSSCSH
jgi:hypothetical protein